MVRVMVVDDSWLVREVLREILEQDPQIDVFEEAQNGAEAVEKCLQCEPDVVLMDIQMPVMDGIEAVERIMAVRPTPVIVLSASVQPGEVRSAFRAMRAGALDALAKPRGLTSPEAYAEVAADLVSRVKLYARVGKKKGWSKQDLGEVEPGEPPLVSNNIVAIGASTGGPGTLGKMLGALGRDFPCPILLVQHMSEGFMGGFAEWLDRETELEVVQVEEALRLSPGRVYLPPDGYHLKVARGAAVLRGGPPVNGCRPSVDVLFESLAKECGEQAVAVLLTGMGDDGAAGSMKVREAGGQVIVQDEATSVIFGMPKAAIDAGAATRVEPLYRIPIALGEVVSGGAGAVRAPSQEQESHDILVVDDSPSMLAMISDVVTAQGYRVRQVESGALALEEVERQVPDLVILDVMMPGMDGYAVCKALRQHRDYIPVLMVTAKNEPQDLVRGLEAGADDYIAKPFESMEMTARVKSLLRIRSLQKRLYNQNAELESKNSELSRLAQALDRANKDLTLLSVTDGLTRAYNHRHFQERLRSEFARAERYGAMLSCLLIDLDHFKKVNDTHGHPAGDQVLTRLVEMLQSSVRNEDLVARYGGEEFVLLLPETPRQRARILAERIRERVEQEPFSFGDDETHQITISIGLTCYEPGGEVTSPDQLIAAADAALYAAKKNGRNRTEMA